MRFGDKLKKLSQDELWAQYCGFLDLSCEQYMDVQRRLLEEQIALLSTCELGRRLFGDRVPQSVEEFREQVPLTTYEDYADILLGKQEDLLPASPVVWLETTWESGSRPVKLAPYSEGMLNVYRENLLCATILSAADSKGHFDLKPSARTLYAMAPLPYATGLFPVLISQEYDLRFMPPLKDVGKLSFEERNRQGFKMAVKSGMDMFFGMSSVIVTITRNFNEFLSGGNSSIRNLAGIRPRMLWKLLRAKYLQSCTGRPIRPADLFDLQALVCVGTDTALFKDELEEAWGRRPMEIHGGTEPTCIGTETWSRDGLAFFPDACFYEFIPEQEVLRNMEDPAYVPKTYLMNELSANQNYELVITVLKGGAFARYRVGDMYRCLRLQNKKDGIDFPQFEYLDRVPSVIDIAGFTRITERAVNQVLHMSRLGVHDWFALKEYDGQKRAFMHMYVEMEPDALAGFPITEQIIREHIGVYFRHYDHDYKDLKRMLQIEPLAITLIPTGSIAAYEAQYGTRLRRINPTSQSVLDLLHVSGQAVPGEGAGV